MILVCFGTRPEFIKITPLIKSFEKNKIDYKLLYISQHTDLIKEIRYDIKLTIENYSKNRLNNIMQSILNRTDIFNNVDYVLVQGDTTSCLGIAISAFNNNKKIIHLEAGLRTFDFNNPFPEEGNRRLISHIANIHFCPTENSRKNLLKEGIEKDVYVVGNTVLDNLKDLDINNNLKTRYDVIITMHRRENHQIIKDWFLKINSLKNKYRELSFCFIKHPNPSVLKHLNILSDIDILEPMSRIDLLSLLSNSKYLITDSGGLQEESSYFKIPALVCRKVTERPEGLENFSLLCKDFKFLQDDFAKLTDMIPKGSSPYGNGETSSMISNILKENYLI